LALYLISQLFKEAFKALRPGGYLEACEHGVVPLCHDGTLKEDTELMKAANLFIEGGKKIGQELQVIHLLKKSMEDAGFEDINEITYNIPMNSWPKSPKMKEIGRFFLATMMEGLPGFVMHVWTNFGGLSSEEVQAKVDRTMKEMKNRAIHGYYPLRVVYGRRPE